MKGAKFLQKEIVQKINTEEDFVNSSKYNYSLKNIEEKNPNGVTDRYAASLLAMTLEEFQELWSDTIKMYQRFFKVKND